MIADNDIKEVKNISMVKRHIRAKSAMNPYDVTIQM